MDSYYTQQFMLVKDLTQLGIPGISFFSKMRKIEADEDQLYKLNRVQAQDWCDERLLRAAKTFTLTESDIFGMRRTFEAMLRGRNRATLKVEEMFNYCVRHFTFFELL
jgi:hypothetical protein